MLRKLLPLVGVILLLCTWTALAQNATLTGTVSDAEAGETIPGVNVVLLELNQGAASDEDGRYELGNIPPGTYTVRATFVGYDAFETEVTLEAGETVVRNVELQPGAIGIDEVVVTGYGGQQRVEEISGSVGNIAGTEIEDATFQNAEEILQGRVAGVTVNSTSGNPGGNFDIEVRGLGSINADNNPLYVVDGVQVSQSEGARNNSTNVLSAINPRDIESIEVLKDASAAAIYGAQAASGVVLITTKSGREGDVEVSVNYESGVRFQSNRLDKANRDQWVDFQFDAFGEETTRQAIFPAFGQDPNTPIDELPDFEWQDFVFRRATTNKFNFSATGGSAETQYRISGNWENTDSAVKEVSFERFGLNFNLDQDFTDRFRVSTKINITNEDVPGVCQDGFFINCPFFQALQEEPPIVRPFLENGDLNPNTEQFRQNNPATTFFREFRSVDKTQILGNIQPTLTITPWLDARGTLGMDFQRFKENDFETPDASPGDGGNVNRTFDDVTNITLNLTLNADYTFGDKHNVTGLGGTEYRREFEDDDSFSFAGFGNDLLGVPSAADQNTFFSGFDTEFRLLSYFGRASYNYDGRYIGSFTVRYDGSSRFGSENRWGLFPSFSAAWRIGEEEFLGDVDLLDELKVRASYGVTGNSGIGNFDARGLFSTATSNEGVVGIAPDQLANPQLTWEENREVNFGIDYSLWNGRLSGSVDLYRGVNDELLLDRPLAISSGFGSITQNVGKVRNKGVEFQIETVNIQTESFRWSTRGNLSLNVNTVKELSGDIEELDPGSIVPVAEGKPINAWKVDIWAGVNPADGRPLYRDQDGNLTYFPSEEDRQFFDAANEDAVGGMGTTLQYKGFTFDAFFDFQYGGTKLPNTLTTGVTPFGEGVLERADDRWREPGDTDAIWPRAEPFNNFANAQDPDGNDSNYFLFDNTFLRLKNITVSYRLPSDLLDRMGLSGARIYFTAANLITWDSYPGLDPEVNGTFESASFPDEGQINMGVELDI